MIHIQDQIKYVEKRLGYCKRDLIDEIDCNIYLSNKYDSDVKDLLDKVFLNTKILDSLNNDNIQDKNKQKLQFYHQTIIYQQKEVIKIYKIFTRIIKNKLSNKKCINDTLTEYITNCEILKKLIKINDERENTKN